MRLGVEAALIEGRLVPGDVEIADGVVARHGLASPNGRGIASPGFLDLQVNGFGGVDFLEADAGGFCAAAEALLETGVTAFLPTLITAPEAQVLTALRALPRSNDGARILGVHLEGPFISPARLGAHPAEHRRDPDRDLLERLVSAGPVRLVTLAPELAGAGELIDLLRPRGIAVSAGHSDATVAESEAAFDRGVRAVTHVFNAMRPLHHRDPGLAGAALVRDDVVAGMIVDGVHLADETVKLVWRAAAGRVALVTDAIYAAGATALDGPAIHGGREVTIRDGAARRADGVLAGSLLTMIDAVRNLHALGVPLEDALNAATAVPAGVIGERSAGRLVDGGRADVVVLDGALEIDRVVVGGEVRVAA